MYKAFLFLRDLDVLQFFFLLDLQQDRIITISYDEKNRPTPKMNECNIPVRNKPFG